MKGRDLAGRPLAGRPLSGWARGEGQRPMPTSGNRGDTTPAGTNDVILMGDGVSAILMGDGVSYILMGR